MKNIALVTLLFCGINVFGQKEDYNWLSGYDGGSPGYDTSFHRYYGINTLDFNYSPRQVRYDSTIGFNFDRTIVSYSDTSGHLLFYSNGIEIHNKWNQIIQNGAPLNDGYFINHWYPEIRTNGYRLPQGLLALPIPGSELDQFLFFQCFIDTNSGAGSFFSKKLLTSYLSMKDNSGHGKVLYRDSTLIADTIVTCISACRHGNGKDWWLLVREMNESNCFYRILLDQKGAHVLADKTCMGIKDSSIFNIDACRFSPDGNKYALVDNSRGVSLYDFDRCSGMLSNPHNYLLPFLLDSGWNQNEVAFSSNSRFLYFSLTAYVLQFDTWQSDPFVHPDTVARFDGYADPSGSYYCSLQLGPDGKIYVSTGNAETNYSVIDSPDMAGAACHFMPHSLHVWAFQNGLPNNPNYRLGRQIGSPCDTLTALMEINSDYLDMRVYPNPAQNMMVVDYGLADWSRHLSLELRVTDITGQQIYSASLSRYSALHKINSSSFASGMYLVEILDSDGRMLSVKKVVKE